MKIWAAFNVVFEVVAASTSLKSIQLPSHFSSWYEVEDWLASMYEKAE